MLQNPLEYGEADGPVKLPRKWVALAVTLWTMLTIFDPTAIALSAALGNGMKLTLDFGVAVQEYSSTKPLPLWINATDLNGQSIPFAYFGTWQIESYLGSVRGGNLARGTFAGNATDEIHVDSFKPKIGVIVVTLGGYTLDGRWAVNQSFIVLERNDTSIGTFTVNLEAKPGVGVMGIGYFITSYSYLTLSGTDVANATIFYFTDGGQLTPPLGISDDDGHDRVFFAPFPCSDQSATIVALALHPDHGVSIGWISVPATDSSCQKPQAIAAEITEIERVNATHVLATVRVVVRLPPAIEELNVTLQVLPETGRIEDVLYRGNVSNDHTWLVSWLTDIPIQPTHFAVLGVVGRELFAEVVNLVRDVQRPSLIHQAVSSSVPDKPIPVTVYASDPSGIWRVQLAYRVNDGTYSRPQEMNSTDGVVYNSSIPAQSAGAVCYYVEATDFWGNVERTPATDCNRVDIGLPPPQFSWLVVAVLIFGLVALVLILFVALIHKRKRDIQM